MSQKSFQNIDANLPWLFSSPEHNMLRMSYCDRSMSGVHPSVNNYLKNLLLGNRLTDFNETSQKLYLVDALTEYFKEYFKDLKSVTNSGCQKKKKL